MLTSQGPFVISDRDPARTNARGNREGAGASPLIPCSWPGHRTNNAIPLRHSHLWVVAVVNNLVFQLDQLLE
jgi:hypothetical protein